MLFIKSLKLIVFLSPIVCIGQSKVYFQAVAGNYAMREMKQFQTDLNDDFWSSGFATKVVSDFPKSLQVTVGYDKMLSSEKYSIGGFLNYGLTKGRLHYGDYSGQIYADQNVSRLQIGARGSASIAGTFAFYSNIGFNYTKLDLELNSIIYNGSSVNNDHKFHSIGINLEPGFCWSYNYKKLISSLQVGYEINVQGKTVYQEDKQSVLINGSGEKVAIDWSGFRLGIGLGYRLRQ
jgi:hypothetical protein